MNRYVRLTDIAIHFYSGRQNTMPLNDTVSPDIQPGQASHRTEHQAMLAALRQRIRHLDPGVVWRQGRDDQAVVPLDIAPLDDHLPGGGLFPHALHEVVAGAGPGNIAARAAATGFAAFVLARLSRQGDRHPPAPVLWCCQRGNGRRGGLYMPGLAAYGLSHDHVLVAQGLSSQEILWAMEEGLASGALAAVIGEPGKLDMIALRRLQLAAESGRTTALLLCTERALPASSPAYTRWHITPRPLESSIPYASAAMFHWQVALTKCRGGRPATWHLNSSDFSCPSLIPKSLEHLSHDIHPTTVHTRTPGAVSLAAGVRNRSVSETPTATACNELRHTG